MATRTPSTAGAQGAVAVVRYDDLTAAIDAIGVVNNSRHPYWVEIEHNGTRRSITVQPGETAFRDVSLLLHQATLDEDGFIALPFRIQTRWPA